MTTNRSTWGGWLLLVLCVVFAATYFWGYRGRTDKAASAVDQVVASPAGVKQSEPAQLEPAVASRPTISADGTAAVPIQFQLAHVGRIKTAPSFQEWLGQFPLDQQAKISAFNDAHFGVYRVNSREQVAWMAANGYPMPEDVVAAESLSDMDLFKLAGQGNDKAAFLLAERQDKELVAFLAEGGTRNAYYDGMEGGNRLDEQAAIDRLIKQSNSPYKGYVQASEPGRGLYAGQGQDVTDIFVTAGLMWAQQLGDTRAIQFLNDYVGGNPQRMVILGAATAAALNSDADMAFMARSGAQRAGAAGRGIPGGAAPVH